MTERAHSNSSYLNVRTSTGAMTRAKDTSSISGMRLICVYDCLMKAAENSSSRFSVEKASTAKIINHEGL